MTHRLFSYLMIMLFSSILGAQNWRVDVVGSFIMSGIEKKQHERYILERFLEALADATLPDAEAFRDSESPDFLLGLPSPAPLGIEVSELNHPGVTWSGLTLRQEEGMQERLCHLIEEEWDTSELPVAEVWLDFIGHPFPAKKSAPEFTEAVLQLIKASMPDGNGVKYLAREDLWQHPVLGPFLNSLTLFRWDKLAHPFVTANRSAFLPPLTHSILQNVISRKNMRVPDYHRQCERVWLVVALHSTELATYFSPHEAAIYDAYDVAFERAFVLDVLDKTIVAIRKTNPET